MYWQLIVLWCLGIWVAPSLTYSLQQCVFHRTPFTTTCPIQASPDLSSVLFPQTSDLGYVVQHDDADPKNPSIGYISDQQHQDASHSQGHNMVVYDSSPPSSSSTMSPTINAAAVTASTSPASTAIAKRRVTIPSFEEWKKRIRQNEETDDNNRKPKRKSSRGTTNQGRETIDSVDGGFSDDVGSVFETGDPNGPVSTAENTYEEGEYIAPQKQQQQQSNKKHFAQVPLKSLKERFNYAWTICAATVRDVNKEARGAQSILFESKDQYLLNKCSVDKFVIINLCEEILIDTIVLANFEFFSSTFKDFRVYVANTYPTKEWQLLGQWQARNTRDLQVFKVQDSIGWFEYIKIEFLTHYGNEYYCPLSLVRVHGMPMMEYFNAVESQGLSGDGGGGEKESLSDQHLWPADVRDDIIHPQLVTNTSEWFPSKGDTDLDNDDTGSDPSGQQTNAGDNGKTTSMILPADDMEQGKQQHAETTDSVSNNDQHEQQQPDLVEKSEHQSPPSSTSTVEPQLDEDISNGNTSSVLILPTTTLEEQDGIDEVEQNNDTRQTESETFASTLSTTNESEATSTNENDATNRTTHSMDFTTLNDTGDSNSNSSFMASTSSSIDLQPSSTFAADDNSTLTGVLPPSTDPSPTWHSENDTTTIHSDSAPSSVTTTASPSAGVTSTTKTHEPPINNDDTRHKNTHNKEPATQESIYKIIMKRLNALEANATLSQRYLDEQNNMLNDVFGEMEKRHQDQLIFVLDRLNETASNRIDGMKRRYEQSYAELKHQMESDMREMTAKISILTDQISFEKRVSMAQLAIVVTLFVFLALSRGTMSTLSPVMIAQAEERKRRQSDTTATSTKGSSTDGSTNQRREPSSLASMTKNKLNGSKLSLSSSSKIKLDMDGRKAASLDALKLHLAQQADLLPKLPSRMTSSSQSLQKPGSTVDTSASVDSTTTTTTIKATSSSSADTHRQQQQQQEKNRQSISLNDITNGKGLETTTTHNGKIGSNVVSENNNGTLMDAINTSEIHHVGSVVHDDIDDDDGLHVKTKSRNHGRGDDNSMDDGSAKEISGKSSKSNLNLSPPSPADTSLTDEKPSPPISLNDNDDDFRPEFVEFEQQQENKHTTTTNIK